MSKRCRLDTECLQLNKNKKFDIGMATLDISGRHTASVLKTFLVLKAYLLLRTTNLTTELTPSRRLMRPYQLGIVFYLQEVIFHDFVIL